MLVRRPQEPLSRPRNTSVTAPPRGGSSPGCQASGALPGACAHPAPRPRTPGRACRRRTRRRQGRAGAHGPRQLQGARCRLCHRARGGRRRAARGRPRWRAAHSSRPARATTVSPSRRARGCSRRGRRSSCPKPCPRASPTGSGPRAPRSSGPERPTRKAWPRRSAAAEDHGWTLLSDSSWPGYTDLPWRVMEGYLQLAAETVEQIAPTAHAYPAAGRASAVLPPRWPPMRGQSGATRRRSSWSSPPQRPR